MSKVKFKTKKAVSKRFKRTGSGKLKRKGAFRSHLAQNKSHKRKRHSKKDKLVHPSDYKRLKQTM